MKAIGTTFTTHFSTMETQPQFLAVSQLGPQDITIKLCEKDTVQSCVKVASVSNTNFRQIKDTVLVLVGNAQCGNFRVFL